MLVWCKVVKLIDNSKGHLLPLVSSSNVMRKEKKSGGLISACLCCHSCFLARFLKTHLPNPSDTCCHLMWNALAHASYLSQIYISLLSLPWLCCVFTDQCNWLGIYDKTKSWKCVKSWFKIMPQCWIQRFALGGIPPQNNKMSPLSENSTFCFQCS